MSVCLKNNFPVAEALKSPRVSFDKVWRKIAIVNIMPDKIRTESDFIRIFDSFEESVEIDFLYMSTHQSKSENTRTHLEKFYIPLDKANLSDYDGLILTGAPVELHDFEDVDYWQEFVDLMEKALKQVPSTIYICWSAFAALYHRYGIRKEILPNKISGAYINTVMNPKHNILKGFDLYFDVPHSRNTCISNVDLNSQIFHLDILASNELVGPHLIADRSSNDFYQLGHWEYNADTLDMEFKRDSVRGLNPQIPENYYNSDIPENGYHSSWQPHGKLFFYNWLKNFARR